MLPSLKRDRDKAVAVAQATTMDSMDLAVRLNTIEGAIDVRIAYPYITNLLPARSKAAGKSFLTVMSYDGANRARSSYTFEALERLEAIVREYRGIVETECELSTPCLDALAAFADAVEAQKEGLIDGSIDPVAAELRRERRDEGLAYLVDSANEAHDWHHAVAAACRVIGTLGGKTVASILFRYPQLIEWGTKIPNIDGDGFCWSDSDRTSWKRWHRRYTDGSAEPSIFWEDDEQIVSLVAEAVKHA